MTDLSTGVPTGHPGPQRPATGGRGALRLLAVALAVLVVAFSALSLVSLLARSSGQFGASYSGVTVVEVDLAFESLQVTATDGDQVALDRSYSWSFRRPSISQRRSGDRLTVSSSGCGFSPGRGCGGRVRLDVPRDTTLRLRTSNSSLTLRDLTGTIDATTSNGRIEATGLVGPAALRTSNGGIEAFGTRSTRLAASTSNGSVRLSFDAAPADVTARTSNGSVEVLVPRDGATYRVEASTSNGRREVAVPTDPAAPRRLTATTSNGSVRVLDRPLSP